MNDYFFNIGESTLSEEMKRRISLFDKTIEKHSMIKSKKSKKRDKKDPTLEHNIQSTIIEYLAKKGIMYWRNNTGVDRSQGRYIRYGQPGSPDIMCIIKQDKEGNIGRFCAIEVKSKTGKQSDVQKKWQEKCEKNGGLYFCVSSLDEVIDIFNNL